MNLERGLGCVEKRLLKKMRIRVLIYNEPLVELRYMFI